MGSDRDRDRIGSGPVSDRDRDRIGSGKGSDRDRIGIGSGSDRAPDTNNREQKKNEPRIP